MSLENTIGAAKNEITALKYDLKQLDNEICYYEEQNRRHQQAQSQLVKANEYEVCRSKELQISEADAKVRLQTRSSEVASLDHELKVLKDQNSAQIDESNVKQGEIDALTKHMNLITNQNYELSAELQRFLQTDEVVKSKLNRRSTVDEIRHKVDTAIRRSQKEVDDRRSPVRHETVQEDRMCYRHASSRGNDRSTSNNARASAAAATATDTYNGDRRSSPLRSKSPPRR